MGHFAIAHRGVRLAAPPKCGILRRLPNPCMSQNFTPDTGIIEVFRSPGGMGIRIDDGPGFQGANITPHYDSLLLKITATSPTRRVGGLVP